MSLSDLIWRCENTTAGDQCELLEDAFDLCFPKPSRVWVTDNTGAWTDEYSEHHERSWRFSDLMEAGAYLDAARELLAPHTLWAVGCMEEGPFARICWPQPDGGYTGGYFQSYAPGPALALCAAALKARAAQAGEAGTAETTKIGSVHEHAVGNADAPKGAA